MMGSRKTQAKALAAQVAKRGAGDAQYYRGFHFRQRKNGPQLVVFRAPVAEILSWADVERLGPKRTGPQRERKEARVEGIRKFLQADDKNTIPTAIILAFDKGAAAFERDKGAGADADAGRVVVRHAGHAIASVVDGQHRLFGMKEFDPKMEVAVVGLIDADPVEEAFQFLVINNKASRVPATHTKALLARMKNEQLMARLRKARLAFDSEGIKDLDLINSDPDSPFYQCIDWATTPKDNRIVQATAIQLSLDYLEGLGVPEFDDRDVRRSVFLAIWKSVKSRWPNLWKMGSRLVSKVGVICLTRFIADRITSWSDSDELDIEVTDLEQIEKLAASMVLKMNEKFWTAAWAEKAQGGFDTAQGRDRVLAAIVQLYRNGKRDEEWYTDIDIIDRGAGNGAQ